MISYSKIILAGLISGFVALTTSILGVTGTVIGTVIASIFYNFLSEHLENQMEKAEITAFENELIFLLPLAIIAIIQFILIFSLLSPMDLGENGFLNIYLSLQDLANNNLYRILGISTLLISIYPMFLKGKRISRNQGFLLSFVGVIFLLRGFLDFEHSFVDFYDDFYYSMDLYLAIIAFIILIYLIITLSLNAYGSNSKKTVFKSPKSKEINVKNEKPDEPAINTAVEDIEFVSNDLLKYKKR